MKYSNIQEEEVKNKVAQDFFQKFDCTKILGKIDFAVAPPSPPERGEFPSFGGVRGGDGSREGDSIYFLWAEAKQKPSDVFEMLAQLVLTIGKARTFNEILPPPFLGCFDPEKIAFVPYSDIQDIFYQNDFNWKVAPSDYNTKEFQLIFKKVKESIDNKSFLFYFEKDKDELRQFIRENFHSKGINPLVPVKIRIDKNNFLVIYNKWLKTVKPTITVDWEKEKKNGIIDCDFYLADLLSSEDKTLREKLSVLLKTDLYELNIEVPTVNFPLFTRIGFSDNQKAHEQFWTKYERPPAKEYWNFMVDHRHLLVPQDVRERKGSFYTPPEWVELSQKYLADVFGKDWQDEYYVWDCAAGTGNLLVGLINKYNIWASTIDKADVDVMKDRIQNGANLLESHVFQFDFLNDDFSKLPTDLQDIINNPELRKKLIIYINPPYVEGDSRIGKGRKGTQITKIHEKYQKDLGKASGELFAQFLMRIYSEIPSCLIAHFSTLKILQAPNFEQFRTIFLAKLQKIFLIPADTFDNVNGQFPIGFFVWNTSKREKFKHTTADVFNEKGDFLRKKRLFSYNKSKYISDWLEKNSKNISNNYIGHLASVGNDFQHQKDVYIDDVNRKKIAGGRHTMITIENLIVVSIYFTVRRCLIHTWLNNQDQFSYPNSKWEKDTEFQNDCLAYTLFNNNIQSKYGINHWIPFMEKEVDAKNTFASHFMVRFITGKKIQNAYANLFDKEKHAKRKFSPEAKKVFDAGRGLWKYYHKQPNVNVNASLYDIKEYFKGRNEKGNMNQKSTNPEFNDLDKELTAKLKLLAQKIEPKVYEYGFLKT